MKLLQGLLLLFIYSNLTLAQSTEEFEWTKELAVKKTVIYGKAEILTDTPSHLLGEINGVLFYKALKALYGIKDGKIVSTFKTKNNAYHGERIEVFQNKLLYFDIKGRDLFLTQHNPETGESIGETIQLTNRLPRKSFHIRPEQKGDFLAIYFHSGELLYEESGDCFYYLVLNDKLEVIHANEVNNEIRYAKQEGVHLPILLEDGRVLSFYKNEDEGHYNLKIHAEGGVLESKFNVSGGSLEEHMLMNDPELFLQKDGSIKAFWTFMDSDKKFKPKDGKRNYTVMSFEISPDGSTSTLEKSAPFLSYPNSIKEYGLFNTVPGRFHFRQRKGYWLGEEEAYIGLGENEFVDAHTGSSGVLKPNLYLFDIYAYKLDKKGEILWSHTIRKHHPRCLNYGSYCSFISGGNLCLVFTDASTNYKNNSFSVQDSKLPDNYGLKNSCIALVKINLETGELTREKMFKIQNVSQYISPTDHYITDQKVHILSGRNAKMKILTFKIE